VRSATTLARGRQALGPRSRGPAPRRRAARADTTLARMARTRLRLSASTVAGRIGLAILAATFAISLRNLISEGHDETAFLVAELGIAVASCWCGRRSMRTCGATGSPAPWRWPHCHRAHVALPARLGRPGRRRGDRVPLAAEPASRSAALVSGRRLLDVGEGWRSSSERSTSIARGSPRGARSTRCPGSGGCARRDAQPRRARPATA